MDLFFESGFAPLIFLVGSLAMAIPFAVFSAAWRRPWPPPLVPPPPYGADAPDATAAAGSTGPTCAVCLEELGRDGPSSGAFATTTRSVYTFDDSCNSHDGRDGGSRRQRVVAAPPQRVALCCGHVFHGGCIYRWVAMCTAAPSCPVCKTPIGAPLWEVVVK